MKMRRGIVKDKRGFTGLEAAIVLTAFIVVAAVFSYMVLGAGFFSTEKAKSVIHTGIEKATSSAEVTGDVIGHGWLNGSVNATGYWNTTNGIYGSYYAWGEGATTKIKSDTTNLTVVEFQVELTAGQEAMDMDKVVFSYTDNDTYIGELTYLNKGNASLGNLTQSATTGSWNYSLATSEMGSANMLDPNEKMTIIVALPNDGVVAYQSFSIDLKPAMGGAITLTKTPKGAIADTVLLY